MNREKAGDIVDALDNYMEANAVLEEQCEEGEICDSVGEGGECKYCHFHDNKWEKRDELINILMEIK